MHFSASVPNFYVQEHFPYWGHVEVLENPLEPEVVGGRLPVRDAPGFGVALREEALRDFAFARIDLA
ncbi:Gluconate dehydratase [Lutibaculum baratangense AMV1]|uniref:Gluconate dehydratase n=2 Tax=Lutibaculum TaxID=1358438 RepID=V4QYW8_9HYPH|nr:Gluconate dehydratase [Lutibaculum baratangense AMV1]